MLFDDFSEGKDLPLQPSLFALSPLLSLVDFGVFVGLGDMEGTQEGAILIDGRTVGRELADGKTEGSSDGRRQGLPVGSTEGSADGKTLGSSEGRTEGSSDGKTLADGSTDGSSDGRTEGSSEGNTFSIIPRLGPSPSCFSKASLFL